GAPSPCPSPPGSARARSAPPPASGCTDRKRRLRRRRAGRGASRPKVQRSAERGSCIASLRSPWFTAPSRVPLELQLRCHHHPRRVPQVGRLTRGSAGAPPPPPFP